MRNICLSSLYVMVKISSWNVLAGMALVAFSSSALFSSFLPTSLLHVSSLPAGSRHPLWKEGLYHEERRRHVELLPRLAAN